MGQAARFQETLRRLAIFDEGFVVCVGGVGVSGIRAAGEDR